MVGIWQAVGPAQRNYNIEEEPKITETLKFYISHYCFHNSPLNA